MFKYLLVSFFCACAAFSGNRLQLDNTRIIPNNWVIDNHNNMDNTIKFTILLPQNQVGINKLLDKSKQISDIHSRDYGRYLSKKNIDNQISTTSLHRDPVINWLDDESNGKLYCHNYSDNIKCVGEILNIEQIFKTTIQVYKNINYNLTIKSGRATGISIPEHLSNSIDYVLGLIDFPQMKTHVKSKQTTNGNIVPYSIKKLYNITDRNFSHVSSQAVVEFMNDECFNINDLTNFTHDNNLRNITFDSSHLIGKCDITSEYPDTEATLDIQYQVGINDQSYQQYVTMEYWMYDMANSLYNMKTPPFVNSMSWGWAEWDQCGDATQCEIGGDSEVYTKRTNNEFMKLTLRGVTLVSSSGDAGAAGRTDEQCTDPDHLLNPAFPASSPWVLSVGGTIITNEVILDNSTKNIPDICVNNSCIIGGDELNCNFDRCGWTSGGGFSDYFNRPWWQVNASNSYLNSSVKFPPKQIFNRLGRVYPDISAVSHNFLIRMDGEYSDVDGTSASAPSISGMIGILNNLRVSQGKSVLGLVGPLLYEMEQNCPTCFKDIVVGSNNSTESGECKYGYQATKGFDAVYGVGVPNFEEIYNFVKNLKY
tara:strand:- start:25 stop:1806 length:1782 start_codon:yes stop_codon:yes gene_type:complete